MTDPKRLLSGEGTEFQRSLLRAGEAEDVPPEVSMKMAAALGIGAASLPPPIGDVVSTSTTTAGSKLAGAGLLKLGAGLAVVGGIVTGALMWGSSDGTGDASPVPTPAHVHAPELAADVADEEIEAPESVVPADELQDDEAVEAVDEQSVTPRAPTSRRTRGATVERRSAGNVDAEVKLLDAARGALAKGDRGKAQRLLDQYSARFPRGMLRREATVLRRAAEAGSTSED